MEHGDRIVEDALRSPHFRDYVRRTGPLCLQFGFSDSGRYVGQKAATFWIERLRPKIAAALAGSAGHTSELQSLMRHSYGVFCLKIKTDTCHPNSHSLSLASHGD